MTNKEAAKILRGMVDFDFRKKKNTALTMGWTALRDAGEAKSKILELSSTVDKQNDLIRRYQEALRIAFEDFDKLSVCCEGGCPRYAECCADDEPDLEDGGYDCEAHMINTWKREAGIEEVSHHEQN